MARHCTVCQSEHRPQVELGLVHGLSAQTLATRFGLSKDAIGRHARRHLSPATAAAILTASNPTAIDLDALTEREGSALLANLVVQRARLAETARTAAESGELGTAVAAERAIGANLETTGKLLQRFVMRRETVSTHLLLSPDWLATRATILRALAAFPEAGRAVADALIAMEKATVAPPMIEVSQ